MKRTLVVLLALVLGLVGGACDRPPQKAVRGPGLKVGDTKLIGLVTENGCTELLSWLQSQAAAHRDRWHGGVVAYAKATDLAATSQEATAGAARSSAAVEDAATAPPSAPAAGVDYS